MYVKNLRINCKVRGAHINTSVGYFIRNMRNYTYHLSEYFETRIDQMSKLLVHEDFNKMDKYKIILFFLMEYPDERIFVEYLLGLINEYSG
jgi:hypothetical protein